MNSISNQLKDLQRRIVGYREIKEFEYTFGKTVEEQNNITALNPWQRRIISELEFAYRLSASNKGAFDELIGNAICFLTDAINRQGVITNDDAKRAEELLLPMQQKAKEYSVILVAHAHIDMNWMWSWHETVAATLDTFRTMLAMMDEYPDFHFSQSQAAVYKIVEEFDPKMMEQIKNRIKEGRWEVSASTWVENDKNMPGTEALMRHNLYTKKYLSEKWGIKPDSLMIDFSPDTFGHSENMPEIMKNGEVKYCYHCRGNYDGDILYRWKAPSGAEALVYREPYWYNSAITPHIGVGVIDLSEKCAGLKTGLIVYGVGNHGGGPTRRDIESAIEMQNWPLYPTIQFGTLHSFFLKAESVREKLPIIDHELNHIFTGCYTTQSRIKLGNKKSEAALSDAESINALVSSMLGAYYPHTHYERAWQNIMFNHFHDILTGSCVQDSREHAMGLYSEALAVANTGQSNAMRAITAQIDTSMYKERMDLTSQSEGAGAGYGAAAFHVSLPESGSGRLRLFHIFNPSPHKRKEVVELTVWDWNYDMGFLQFLDSKDQKVTFQVIDKEHQKYWDHFYFRVLVEVELPSMGYETIIMKQSVMEYPFYYHPIAKKNEIYNNYLLENEFIRAEFDYKGGNLVSLIDKKTGMEQIKKDDCSGFRIIQADGSKTSAWVIGRYTSLEKIVKCTKLSYIKGELRTSLEMEIPILNSIAKVKVILDKGQSVLRYEVDLDWKEYSTEDTTAPLLNYMIPIGFQAERFLHDVPAGQIFSDALNQDIPAPNYNAAIYKGRALALTSDCKYGYRNTKEGVSLTLIHTPHRPDPYPERGIHQIHFGIFLGEASPKVLYETAFDFSHLPVYLSDKPHEGNFPLTMPFLELNKESDAIITGVKLAEQGNGLIMHMVNTSDRETIAAVIFANSVKHAEIVNSLELPLIGDVITDESKLSVRMQPHQLIGIKVIFNTNYKI